MKIKQVIMALIDSIKPVEVKKADSFTVDELKFLLLKLRNATYTGHEFETFYTVMDKISKEIISLDK